MTQRSHLYLTTAESDSLVLWTTKTPLKVATVVPVYNKESYSVSFHFRSNYPIISSYKATFPLGALLKSRSVYWYRCGAEGWREGWTIHSLFSGLPQLTWISGGWRRGSCTAGMEEEGLKAWVENNSDSVFSNTKCIISVVQQ